jgi:hypothetical protein
VDDDVLRAVQPILDIPCVPQEDPGNDNVIRVFCTNAEVDACTAQCLEALAGEEVRLESVDVDVQGTIGARLATVLDGTDLEGKLTFKNGARAMLLHCVDERKKYTTGVVGTIRHDGDVLFFRTKEGEEFEVPKITRKVYAEYYGEPVATREQFPVCLAYAVTVHKLQGMTTAAELHADLTKWRPWSLEDKRRVLYVVLSRATRYANLRLSQPYKTARALKAVLQAGLEERRP